MDWTHSFTLELTVSQSLSQSIVSLLSPTNQPTNQPQPINQPDNHHPFQSIYSRATHLPISQPTNNPSIHPSTKICHTLQPTIHPPIQPTHQPTKQSTLSTLTNPPSHRPDEQLNPPINLPIVHLHLPYNQKKQKQKTNIYHRIHPSSQPHNLNLTQSTKPSQANLSKTHLMGRMWLSLGVVVSGTWCRRYWLRSPWSRYSRTSTRGSSRLTTPSRQARFASESVASSCACLHPSSLTCWGSRVEMDG